jgi:YidC/Oxa1 family membrane protein insertase
VGFTAYYQQRQMQARSGAAASQQAQQMQTFMKIFPAILVFISFGLPAGLVIYFLTSNVWQIGQQRIMFKAAPPVAAGSQADGKGGKKTEAKPPGGKPAGTGPGKRASGDGQAKAKKPHPSSKKKKKR